MVSPNRTQGRPRQRARLLIGLIAVALVVASGWPQFFLDEWWTNSWCQVSVLETVPSRDGQYLAQVRLFSCGGAAGSVYERAELLRTNDWWGRSRTPVLVAHDSVNVTWLEVGRVQVAYGAPPRRQGPTSWGEVQIAYAPYGAASLPTPISRAPVP
jgi:hypothetical protein